MTCVFLAYLIYIYFKLPTRRLNMHVVNNYDRDKMEDKLERKAFRNNKNKILAFSFVFKICKRKW